MAHIDNSNNITHVKLVASLAPEFRQKITQKTDLPGLLHLASQLCVLTISSYWITNTLPGWQAAMVLQGILLIFLFTLLHETVHFTPFKTESLNRIAGWFCALIILLPPNWFRYFHLAHHRHTNDPDNDPELEGEKPNTWPQYIWAVSGIPVWKFHFKTIFQNAFGRFDYVYLPKRRIGTVRTEAQIMLAFYLAIATLAFYFKLDEIIWLWLLPVLIGQPFLRLYLMAEHGRCPHVANMLENTRTTYTTRFVRWIAWNMPYHAEHHTYPSVPFHKLPEFNQALRDSLKTTETSYTAYHKETATLLSSTKS